MLMLGAAVSAAGVSGYVAPRLLAPQQLDAAARSGKLPPLRGSAAIACRYGRRNGTLARTGREGNRLPTPGRVLTVLGPIPVENLGVTRPPARLGQRLVIASLRRSRAGAVVRDRICTPAWDAPCARWLRRSARGALETVWRQRDCPHRGTDPGRCRPPRVSGARGRFCRAAISVI